MKTLLFFGLFAASLSAFAEEFSTGAFGWHQREFLMYTTLPVSDGEVRQLFKAVAVKGQCDKLTLSKTSMPVDETGIEEKGDLQIDAGRLQNGEVNYFLRFKRGDSFSPWATLNCRPK